MDELSKTILLTTLAGAAIPIGGLLASIERIRPLWLEREFRHTVIAFGGGVLISAVALVLVPDGIEHLSLGWIIFAFLSGGFAFWGLDSLIQRSQSSLSQLAATLADFIPEAIALGAAFATGSQTGLLLAILIALQNLPEGFNAFRELKSSSSFSSKKILLLFVLMVPIGPLAGTLGFLLLSNSPKIVGFIMLFAASGILYLTFQDLAPQSKIESKTSPALGSVLGFLMGLIGQILVES